MINDGYNYRYKFRTYSTKDKFKRLCHQDFEYQDSTKDKIVLKHDNLRAGFK